LKKSQDAVEVVRIVFLEINFRFVGLLFSYILIRKLSFDFIGVMSTILSAPSFDDIRAAQSCLDGIAIRTPLLKLNYEIPGLEIYLKCEQFQLTSSFKVRGAANIVKLLTMKEKENGIVTASSGNMAQGLSWIARQENIKCRILVPDTTNEVKLKAIEQLGGEITKCTFDEWFQVIVSGQCPMLDGYFIHPVRNQHVMAGHGTIALEILDQLPECDAILGKSVCIEEY
jgi:threonine dehydratase